MSERSRSPSAGFDDPESRGISGVCKVQPASPSSDEFQIDDLLWGDEFGLARVVGLIGRGGMGYVLECERVNSRRRIAVKVIRAAFLNDPRIEATFKKEAEELARLRNNRVIVIHEYFRTTAHPKGIPTRLIGTPCIAMELLQGRPLSAFMKSNRPMDLVTVCLIASEMYKIFDYIHGMELLHRDVKPDNFFVKELGGNESNLVLLDFGICQKLAESKLVDVYMGTPRYSALEQVQCTKTGKYTDLYAVGVILYELLTGGKHPYEGQDLDPARRSAHGRPIPIRHVAPNLPLQIADIIMAAVDNDPAKRPPDIRALTKPFRVIYQDHDRQSPKSTENSTIDRDLSNRLNHPDPNTLAKTLALSPAAARQAMDALGPGRTGTIRIPVMMPPVSPMQPVMAWPAHTPEAARNQALQAQERAQPSPAPGPRQDSIIGGGGESYAPVSPRTLDRDAARTWQRNAAQRASATVPPSRGRASDELDKTQEGLPWGLSEENVAGQAPLRHPKRSSTTAAASTTMALPLVRYGWPVNVAVIALAGVVVFIAMHVIVSALRPPTRAPVATATLATAAPTPTPTPIVVPPAASAPSPASSSSVSAPTAEIATPADTSLGARSASVAPPPSSAAAVATHHAPATKPPKPTKPQASAAPKTPSFDQDMGLFRDLDPSQPVAPAPTVKHPLPGSGL